MIKMHGFRIGCLQMSGKILHNWANQTKSENLDIDNPENVPETINYFTSRSASGNMVFLVTLSYHIFSNN